MKTNSKKYYALRVASESGGNVVGIFTSKAKAIAAAKASIKGGSKWHGRLEYTLYEASINTLDMIDFDKGYLMTIQEDKVAHNKRIKKMRHDDRDDLIRCGGLYENR